VFSEQALSAAVERAERRGAAKGQQRCCTVR